VDTLRDGCKNHDFYYYVPSANNRLLLPEIASAFHQYIEERRKYKKHLYLRHKETGDRYIKDLETRYDGAYIEEIVRRAKFLAVNFRNNRSVLLTLTVDPKKYGYNIPKMWEAMMGKNSEFNRFMTILRKINDKSGNPPLKYVATIEAMSGREENDYVGRGLPHIHICFFGVSRLIDWRILRDIWKNGHIWINRTKENTKVRNPVDYVLKYVTKTYNKMNKANELTQALTWFFNARMFNTSRKLVYPLKYTGKTEYEPVFLVNIPDGLPIKTLTDIMTVINNAMMEGG
jgi:hypothetical protein